MELIPVIAIRLLVPFTIRKWPFWGGLLAIAADLADLPLLNALGWQYDNGIEYQSLDKLLDMYYLTFELIVVLRFKDLLVRNTLSALFAWRAIGFVLFEILHIRALLFFAPNVFEFVYLVIIGARTFMRRVYDERALLVWLLLVVTPLKMAHEYILHVAQYPLGLQRFIDIIRGIKPI